MSWKDGDSWKVGMPAWTPKQERANYTQYWAKGKYKVVTIKIDEVEWIFRVSKKTDVILFVMAPSMKTFRGRSVADWAIGKTVSQFMEIASTPLYPQSPLQLTPASDFQFGHVLSPQFRNISPVGVEYFKVLSEKIAEYMTTIFEDYMSLGAEARMYTQPFMQFAAGLMQAKTDTSNLPFILAQQFLEKAPETLGVSQQNVDRFFKELTQEVYTYAPETSYEKLYASYHDAQQLTNERMRGSLRKAEIREMHESQANKVVLKQEHMEKEFTDRKVAIMDMMMDELGDAIRAARQSDRGTAVQRMERLAATVEMALDADSSAMTVNKLVAMEPEFSREVRIMSQDLVNWAPEPDIQPSEAYRVSVRDMRTLDQAKTIGKAHDDRRKASDVAIRTLEGEGSVAKMNKVVTDVYPLLSSNLAESEAHFTRSSNHPYNSEITDKYMKMMYQQKEQKSKLPKVGGKGMFDKAGMLIKSLRPKSKKFKVSRPDMRWGRKLYQGVLDINLKVSDFRERDRPHAINIAMLQHLFQRFGGDASAFSQLKSAVDDGFEVANMHAFYAMLPTFVRMVEAETQHFQGMDKLRAGKRGVFFEFVPPTPSDIQINKGTPFNIRLSLHWARINTSRALAFYRDKEGQSRGERRLRIEQFQSMINAHEARGDKRNRKLFGRGIGFMKEGHGQQFIIQKYLSGSKRSFLENMDKKQFSSAYRNEISALFGDEAGAVVRKAVRSGQSVTLALAQHLRAQPGDRINVFMNDAGEIGTTVQQSISSGGPAGTQPGRERFVAVPTSYKRITTLTVPVLTQTEPMEPVSDSFRGAMRAIRQSGYGGNIFQKLANILWNVDVPLPDWNVEDITLSSAQIEEATTFIRNASQEAETVLSQGVAEERATKKIDDRVIGPAITKILRDPKMISSSVRILMNQHKRVFGPAVDESMVIGWTI